MSSLALGHVDWVQGVAITTLALVGAMMLLGKQ